MQTIGSIVYLKEGGQKWMKHFLISDERKCFGW